MSSATTAEPEHRGASGLTALGSELEVLRGEGAEHFDGPGFGMIRRLLERAAGLDASARDQLLARSAERVADLRRRTRDARRDAEAALGRLAEAGLDDEGALREAFEAGDWQRVQRADRRPRRARPAAHPERRARRIEYLQAVADFSSALGVSVVEDSPPEQAGLLNGTLLAARVLEAAQRISPSYRRHLVGELIDLGALLELPAVAPPRKRR